MKNDRTALFLVVAVIIILIAIFNFTNHKVSLDIDGSATICNSTWWGFKKEYTPLKSVNGTWYYKTKENVWDELIFEE